MTIGMTNTSCRNEPLVRHVEAKGVPDPLEVKPPLRIFELGVVPEQTCPSWRSTTKRPDFPTPSRGWWTRDSSTSNGWNGQIGNRCTPSFETRTWHVLHFIGHGEYDDGVHEGTIALVDVDGRSHMGRRPEIALPTCSIKVVLRPRLVVLNSCQIRVGDRHA